MLNDSPAQITAYDGLQAVRMGAAAELSLKTGHVVEMKSVVGG